MRDRLQALRDLFGLASFRPWQSEAIDALLDDCRPVLVIAPTGGGKSLCYQLPAALLRGTTVVVSPLIALMEDQVRSLTERGIAATYLASTLGREEVARREAMLVRGQLQLVYVAPERLRSARLVSLLGNLRPPLVAIDEAHCISQWGHDFRPDYLRLGALLEELRPPRLLACTATATPTVRREILQRLGMPPGDTAVVMRGFARPNLHLEVQEVDRLAERRKVALHAVRSELGLVKEPRGAAIVYAGTRRNTETLAAMFAERGWRTAAYHAGLAPPVREGVSRRFADREVDVVVATNAFGMGIDRPDIRCVVHTQAPGSIEQYYQEVGRAGRDGDPAVGLLLSGASDFGLMRRLIERPSSIEGVDPDPAQAELKWNLFLDLMRYVEAGSCRHDYILRYFGDEQELLGGCGHCDVCAQLSQGGRGAVGEESALCVRKALAGVARLKRRAGLSALAASLHGDDTQRLRQLGLHRLSTHGLFAAYESAWIMALLRRLVTAGLVDLTGGEFPVPFLTAAGVRTMRGEVAVAVVPPPLAPAARRREPRATRRRAAPEAAAGVDASLYAGLKAWRLEAARAAGVPAFRICGNRTLEAIAAAQPTTDGELAAVHGMGPMRMEAYGEAILRVVQAAGR